jgi:hypothetical protein
MMDFGFSGVEENRIAPLMNNMASPGKVSTE